MSKTCIIIGGGIAGITAALSLTQIGILCTIYELRPTRATIGGSVNLTLNALPQLEALDVEVHGCYVDSIEIFSLHTSKKLGEVPFQKYGPALRIMREELLRALLRTVAKKGISVVYNSKLVAIKGETGDPKTAAIFENGEEAQADFILGCDGVHSAVPVAYSIVDGSQIKAHFHETCMNSGRFGSLLLSYVDPDRTKIYLGAVMETQEEYDKQGWKVRGDDRQKTLNEIDRRCKDSAIPCVNELVELVQKEEDFVFYPVYKLGPQGIWSRGRVLLLGDAAHSMPPQGESTGLAVEDGVLFARVLTSTPDLSIREAFGTYERTRRPRIDKAYREAVLRWEHVKDRSWLEQKLLEWLMWIILWYKTDAWESSVAYDVREEKIIEGRL